MAAWLKPDVAHSSLRLEKHIYIYIYIYVERERNIYIYTCMANAPPPPPPVMILLLYMLQILVPPLRDPPHPWSWYPHPFWWLVGLAKAYGRVCWASGGLSLVASRPNLSPAATSQARASSSSPGVNGCWGPEPKTLEKHQEARSSFVRWVPICWAKFEGEPKGKPKTVLRRGPLSHMAGACLDLADLLISACLPCFCDGLAGNNPEAQTRVGRFNPGVFAVIN